MAFPTSVNNMITDAVTQANVMNLGASPAVAMGLLYQASAQSLANAAHNAALAQQQMNQVSQAATTMSVALLLSLGTGAGGRAAPGVGNSS
ncbi:MAG: RebB family R body protein [Phycisphaerales bacterium]